MNIFTIFAFIVAVAVLVGGLKLASSDLTLFLDYPSMFIVFGGTLAASSISFQLNRVFQLFSIFFKRVLFGYRVNHKQAVVNLVKLTDDYRKGAAIKSKIEESKDPFLKEGLEMFDQGLMDHDYIINLLKSRNENIRVHNMQEANKIKTLSKFPPAFGMVGTTIGMIVLLANLGGEDAMKMIGPAMGVCLITTLYGAVVANLIVIPVAENLIEDTKEIYIKNQIIIRGLELFIQKTNPIIVAEELNSFLNPSGRIDWKKVVGG
jgi:chemotaxis protein MotA